jgi:Uma2 family endonuclease
MGQPAEKKGLSPAEYLALERASEMKHEYADGEVFAMSGCTRAHSLLTSNANGELREALLERPCEVHTSDMRVKIPATDRYVYPDATVVCGEPVFEDGVLDTLMNPQVVVEVLSESSEHYDRGDMFAQYRSIPTVTDYVLVAEDAVRVEHFRRQPGGKWLLESLGPGDALALESVGARIPIDRLYLKVPLPAGAAGA